MTYIEQHSDPKILKLGIKWALYREPKPDKRDYYPDPDGRYFDEAMYNRDLKYHLEFRIVYPKEPEFRAGDIVYLFGDKLQKKVITLVNNENIFYDDNDGYSHCKAKEHCSHYYPGQQVESFKYVRERLINIDACPLFTEWQEVEEPQYEDYNYLKVPQPEQNNYYQDESTQFQKDVDEGITLAILTLKKQ